MAGRVSTEGGLTGRHLEREREREREREVKMFESQCIHCNVCSHALN